MLDSRPTERWLCSPTTTVETVYTLFVGDSNRLADAKPSAIVQTTVRWHLQRSAQATTTPRMVISQNLHRNFVLHRQLPVRRDHKRKNSNLICMNLKRTRNAYIKHIERKLFGTA